MTKRESAEYVLQYGHCRGVLCKSCFAHKDKPKCRRICDYSRMTCFRAKVIAANYLAGLDDDEEEVIIGE